MCFFPVNSDSVLVDFFIWCVGGGGEIMVKLFLPDLALVLVEPMCTPPVHTQNHHQNGQPGGLEEGLDWQTGAGHFPWPLHLLPEKLQPFLLNLCSNFW